MLQKQINIYLSVYASFREAEMSKLSFPCGRKVGEIHAEKYWLFPCCWKVHWNLNVRADKFKMSHNTNLRRDIVDSFAHVDWCIMFLKGKFAHPYHSFYRMVGKFEKFSLIYISKSDLLFRIPKLIFLIPHIIIAIIAWIFLLAWIPVNVKWKQS